MSVLDLGGLIVAAKDYHNDPAESRAIMYTCDEGLSWSELTFTNENVRVFAVITEPGETTTVARLEQFIEKRGGGGGGGGKGRERGRDRHTQDYHYYC